MRSMKMDDSSEYLAKIILLGSGETQPAIIDVIPVHQHGIDSAFPKRVAL